MSSANKDLLARVGDQKFACILADPPWQFQNKTGKVAPEHKRLNRYGTMTLDDIKALPVQDIAADTAHLYLWVPNALLPEGLEVLKAWGFQYKSNIIWHKVRKDGEPDGRGVGFYFRNTTEIVLFGVRGKNARTLAPGRRQVNILKTMKREHSRKPDEFYGIVEACSPGPFLELFARGSREGWRTWGNQADDYFPTWDTYANHSQSDTEKAQAIAALANAGKPAKADLRTEKLNKSVVSKAVPSKKLAPTKKAAHAPAVSVGKAEKTTSIQVIKKSSPEFKGKAVPARTIVRGAKSVIASPNPNVVKTKKR